MAAEHSVVWNPQPSSNPPSPLQHGESGNDIQDAIKEEERKLLKRIKSVIWQKYYYNRPDSWKTCDRLPQHINHVVANSDTIRPRDLGDIKHYTLDELNEMTEFFSERNLLGQSRHSDIRMYTAKIRGGSGGGQDVIVKAWFYPLIPGPACPLFPLRMLDEIRILTNDAIRSSENFVKPIGFHCDKMLAFVYEGGPKLVLQDIILSDKFGWNERMKVAAGVAKMLKEFHDNNKGPHGAVESEYILIDGNYSAPKAFHFGVYCLPEECGKYYDSMVRHAFGEQYRRNELKGPTWLKEYDIFAYGVILLLLISNQFIFPLGKFLEDFKSGHRSTLVHECFGIDDQFGYEISQLAVQCLEVGPKQSSLDDVLQCLEGHRASKLQKI